MTDYTINDQNYLDIIDSTINSYCIEVKYLTASYIWKIRDSMLSQGNEAVTICISYDLAHLIRPIRFPINQQEQELNKLGIFKGAIDCYISSKEEDQDFLGKVLSTNIFSTTKLKSSILFIAHSDRLSKRKTKFLTVLSETN